MWWSIHVPHFRVFIRLTRNNGNKSNESYISVSRAIDVSLNYRSTKEHASSVITRAACVGVCSRNSGNKFHFSRAFVNGSFWLFPSNFLYREGERVRWRRHASLSCSIMINKRNSLDAICHGAVQSACSEGAHINRLLSLTVLMLWNTRLNSPSARAR